MTAFLFAPVRWFRRKKAESAQRRHLLLQVQADLERAQHELQELLEGDSGWPLNREDQTEIDRHDPTPNG